MENLLENMRTEYKDGVLLLDALIGHEDTMIANQIAAMKRLGERLEYLESVLDPVPPASRAATSEEIAEYEATKRGELVRA